VVIVLQWPFLFGHSQGILRSICAENLATGSIWRGLDQTRNRESRVEGNLSHGSSQAASNHIYQMHLIRIYERGGLDLSRRASNRFTIRPKSKGGGEADNSPTCGLLLATSPQIVQAVSTIAFARELGTEMSDEEFEEQFVQQVPTLVRFVLSAASCWPSLHSLIPDPFLLPCRSFSMGLHARFVLKDGSFRRYKYFTLTPGLRCRYRAKQGSTRIITKGLMPDFRWKSC
jgi:hypothetical protein